MRHFSPKSPTSEEIEHSDAPAGTNDSFGKAVPFSGKAAALLNATAHRIRTRYEILLCLSRFLRQTESSQPTNNARKSPARAIDFTSRGKCFKMSHLDSAPAQRGKQPFNFAAEKLLGVCGGDVSLYYVQVSFCFIIPKKESTVLRGNF